PLRAEPVHLSDLLRNAHAPHQIVEAAIRSNRVEPWIDSQIDEKVGAFAISALERVKGWFDAAETYMDERDLERRDESARRCLPELGDHLFGFALVTRNGVQVTDIRRDYDVSVEQLCAFAALGPLVAEPALVRGG